MNGQQTSKQRVVALFVSVFVSSPITRFLSPFSLCLGRNCEREGVEKIGMVENLDVSKRLMPLFPVLGVNRENVDVR